MFLLTCGMLHKGGQVSIMLYFVLYCRLLGNVVPLIEEFNVFCDLVQ
jgi:hypothetical protein